MYRLKNPAWHYVWSVKRVIMNALRTKSVMAGLAWRTSCTTNTDSATVSSHTQTSEYPSQLRVPFSSLCKPANTHKVSELCFALFTSLSILNLELFCEIIILHNKVFVFERSEIQLLIVLVYKLRKSDSKLSTCQVWHHASKANPGPTIKSSRLQ